MPTRDITIIPLAPLRVAAAVATAAALCGCVGSSSEPSLAAVKADSVHLVPPVVDLRERADPDYFPHRFPAPQGEIEPLPPQF